MQNSELCDSARFALNNAGLQSSLNKAASLQNGGLSSADEARIKEVAQDFSEVFYSMLLKEMQETLPEQETAFGSGVQDLMQLNMPKALASSPGDSLTVYLEQQIRDTMQVGDAVNEQA
jgi:Rod binding domain-containing protein